MAAALAFTTAPLVAQWLKHPTPGVPRTADGKPNLAAPTPRTADGKPDFSGMWFTGDPVPCAQSGGQDFLECGIELPISIFGVNMGAKMPGGLPYQPWAAALVKKRTAENSKDDPHARCLPDTFLRTTACRISEVDPGARAARDARRDERQLPPGLHSTAGRCQSIRCPRGTATRRPSGRATRWSSSRSASATTCGSTWPAASSPKRRR